MGVSYSIYELKSYDEISTVYIREGEMRGDDREGGRAAYSTKAKLRMSKYLLRPPDVVVLDLTVWKVPEDPLMLDTESTTSK